MPDSEPATMTIAPACSPADLADVRKLFDEYVASLGIDLSFQDVEREFSDLPGKYAAPAGLIVLARDRAGQPAGCAALRPLPQAGLCEIKRLYVRPQARGHDLGRRLAETIIAHAKKTGYRRIVLDTLASMHAAQKLYASLGFKPTAAYYDNPLPDTRYLALDL